MRNTKHLLLIAAIFISLLLPACSKKDNPPPTIYGCTDVNANNYNSSANLSCSTCCIYNGTATFWVATGEGYNQVYIVIGQETHQISLSYSSTPSCGADGCATFNLAPGDYTYAVAAVYKGVSFTATGTVTVTSSGCVVVQL